MFLDWTSFLKECDLNYFQNFRLQFFSCYLLLYEKIKQKKTLVVYKTDKIDNLYVHEVIRTLVRQCELNPIELKVSWLKTIPPSDNNYSE
jgi:hypothetical protein